MKKTLVLFALFALASLAVAQDVLKSGGVALGVPDHGAYEFILWGGGPGGVNKCPVIQDGFCYLANGTFSLLSNQRTFKGTFNPELVTVSELDSNCEQITFPLMGTLTIPKPVKAFVNMAALYTQTSCNLGGNGTSVFDSGGSLIVYLPGFVGVRKNFY